MASKSGIHFVKKDKMVLKRILLFESYNLKKQSVSVASYANLLNVSNTLIYEYYGSIGLFKINTFLVYVSCISLIHSA